MIDLDNYEAFFSIAPLSRAAHNLKIDLSVNVVTEHSKSLDALMDFWNTSEEHERGVVNSKTEAFYAFVKIVDKKTKGEFKAVVVGRDDRVIFEQSFIDRAEFLDVKGTIVDSYPLLRVRVLEEAEVPETGKKNLVVQLGVV